MPYTMNYDPTQPPQFSYRPSGGASNWYRRDNTDQDYINPTPDLLQTTNQNKMYGNERERQAYYQNQFFDELGNRIGAQDQQAGFYADLYPELYKDIWAGGGGYDPTQLENVVQSGPTGQINSQLEQLGNVSDNDRNAAMLQDWERTQIQGNPYEAFDMFNNDKTADRFRQANAGYENAARGNFNTGAANLRGAVAGMKDAYDASIDPSKLRIDPGYGASLNSTLAGAGGAIRGSYNDPALQVTDQYLAQAPMSDEEVNAQATLGGQAVGAQYRGALDRLEANAAAAGNTNPLALASARESLLRNSAADSGDAIARAHLEARNAQRQAAQNVQDTQLSAGRSRSALIQSGELPLLNARLGALQGQEQMRMGGEQDISNRQMQAAGNVGNLGASTESGIMNTGVGLENTLGARGVGLEQDISNTQIGLRQGAEQQASDRASRMANTSIAGRTRAADLPYQRDMETAQARMGNTNALGARYQSGYAPWLANQQEGRQAAGNAMDTWTGLSQNTMGQKLNAWQTGQAGTLGAIGGYQTQPSMFDRFAGFLQGGNNGYQKTGHWGGAIAGSIGGAINPRSQGVQN